MDATRCSTPLSIHSNSSDDSIVEVPFESFSTIEDAETVAINIGQHSSATVDSTRLISSDLVNILVEDTQFRVCVSTLTSVSDRFGFLKEGSLIFSTPIPISINEPGLTARAFGNLLRVMETRVYQEIPLHTAEEWTDVLHLAVKWRMSPIRKAAIDHLLTLASPIEKIALGREYGIDFWLEDALVALCERAEALTLEEARRIPLEDVVRINDPRSEVRIVVSVFKHDQIRSAVARALGKTSTEQKQKRVVAATGAVPLTLATTCPPIVCTNAAAPIIALKGKGLLNIIPLGAPQ